MNVFCDVIIPIYNAYDATVNCIESVINNTDLKENRLVLINDCSPDERISKHINAVKVQHSELNIVVIENEKNKGFVGTVNVGMRYSDNDVLLLNSDTIVGKNWLDKMKNCAYSQPKVATVTALSNNATLVSVPKGLMRNEIPDDITIDEYNDMLTKCAYREYPELPTSHGFCVYILREALDKVGVFDEESFGRGYGEENDFSFRCMDYGFKNLLCDDVIVYHLESQSFSNERSKVIEEHLEIIQNRYLGYYQGQEHWFRAFPILHICRNVYYNLGLRKKKNVLMVIHEWDNTVGGTTAHVKDIISALSGEFNFHVLYPSGSRYVIESFFGDESEKMTLPFTVEKTARYNRFNNIYREMLDYVVRAFAISTLHIHHMSGHYFDIADVANKYNINSIITLHDTYSICPAVGMLYCNEKYCADIAERDCAKCLIHTERAANNIIPEWQSDWHTFLKKFDSVIVPSNDTKRRINAVYNDVELKVVEHGVNVDKLDYTPKLDRKLRIAFTGVLCRHKGAEMLRNLIKNCNDRNIEFHTFGRVESEFADLQQNTSNYTYHGPYKREEIGKLLAKNKINLICFLQICPETYSYTVNEAVASKIPVLSVDLGAGADRIKENKLGWIVPKDASCEEILETLTSIKDNVDEYQKAVLDVEEYNFKTVDDMGQDYLKVYNVKNVDKTVDYDALRYLVKQEVILAKNIIYNNEVEVMLDGILRSAKWRIVNKIKVPKILSKPLKAIFRLLKRIVKR
ncbi:MAG: glycosyltransferase [Ruminococcaceae bacterium]|nr:glycosyltransferase [Oscillospiraceae bacterium]